MEFYLVAERGYSGSTKISTLKAFSTFTSVGQVAFDNWNKDAKGLTFERYMQRWCPVVLRAEVDSDKKLSRMAKSTVLKKMKADPDLKNGFTKALLKGGA
jgi:hypothetical protein